MTRLLTLIVTMLLIATTAAAQSTLESFTTALDSSSGYYIHRTSYEFTIPTRTSGHPHREVTLDVYYNSRVVVLATARVRCGEDVWGQTVSDSHFASLRVAVAPTTSAASICAADLTFANNADRTGPQSAALHMQVAAEGLRTLTKQTADSSGRGRSSVSPFDDVHRALELWRIAAMNGLSTASP